MICASLFRLLLRIDGFVLFSCSFRRVLFDLSGLLYYFFVRLSLCVCLIVDFIAFLRLRQVRGSTFATREPLCLVCAAASVARVAGTIPPAIRELLF